MLHVLLLILKIIGWILLGIIGLLLLLVILILFCPIRYQADISYQGGKTLQAKAKVRYLILSVRVLYDQSREKDKLKQEIRLLWFRLGKKKAEEAEREVEHLADEGFDDAWEDIDVDSDMDSDDVVRKMSEKSYPKGIQEKTLGLIMDFFKQNPGYQTGDTIAENTGLSCVTVRHYMTYLIEKGQIIESINYETGGRPSSLYKAKN